MEYLKYSPSKLLRIHGYIIIQESTQIFNFPNLVSHDHLLHWLSEILSRIIWRLLHRHHQDELHFLVSPLFLPLSDHSVEPFLHHGMRDAGNRWKSARVGGAFRWRNTKPTSTAKSLRTFLLFLDACSSSFHSRTFEVEWMWGWKNSFMWSDSGLEVSMIMSWG